MRSMKKALGNILFYGTVGVCGLFTLAVIVVAGRPEPISGPVAGVSNSDDYSKYGPDFEDAARYFITYRRCHPSEFEEQGGWVRSVFRKPYRYFIYCDGQNQLPSSLGRYRNSNKVYIRITSGGWEQD